MCRSPSCPVLRQSSSYIRNRLCLGMRFTPIKPGQTADLKSEIKDYEASRKFRDKVREVQDKQKPAAHHVAIEKYLPEKVL
jgi:hypothetical protein